ncbi:MAG: polysaccharide pyruvyl transferase CsaB, partial [Ruminiclostridium sp.]|nr:polysaccharide pyruvyl transferase CsaB [Ruminiclostridium sp.]
HGAKANMFSLAARRYTRLPTVTTVHSDYKLDYMHSLPKRISIGLLNTIALRYIGNYIAVSENFRDMLAGRNFNPSAIYVLYKGMDFSAPLTKYTKENLIRKYRLGFNEQSIIVGIVARLYPVKSIDTLIKAAAIVKKQNPNIKFLIGGDGEDRKELEELTSSLDLKDTVFFLGWLDDPNELMSCVDISVLTSISESFSYSILEGVRFKKTTISSNVGGIPDLIKDGENGFLFQPGDYQRLSELIIRLGPDPGKLVEMVEKKYEKARREFSVEKMCSAQMDIYKRILEKYNAASHGTKYYDAIISGYYGFQNIGDEALLTSIINDLRKYKPEIKMLILSRTPVSTSKEYDVESISRQNPFRIFKAMRKARAFIYGGGNLLQDNTSIRSLFFYLSIVWLANKMKLKIMFYANGIGPLKKKISRLLTRKIMNKVNVITLREKLSYSELKHMDISRPKILLTADSALTVTCKDDPRTKNILKSLGIDTSAKYIGFSLRKYPGHEKVEHELYENVIARLADHMSEKFGLLPVFIPMQHPDDVPILANVAAKMKCRSFIIREKLNVYDTYEIIGKMEMMVAMRLHALVFSAGAGVPMVGLVYDPKIEGFLEYINQASAGDVRNLEFEKLRELTEDVWKRRELIREELGKAIPELREKAGENAKIAVEMIMDKLY